MNGVATLYGSQQSRFARYLERREQRRPDPLAREHRRPVSTDGAGLLGGLLERKSIEHYPAAVEHVTAVEPDPNARAVATERARAAPVPVEVVAGSADALPAADGSFDAAVAIWVLCSVPDVPAALHELRRVLTDGGELRFYEHVRSANPVFRGVQHAVDVLFWKRALGGCCTTRDTEGAIRAAGFELVTLEHGFHSSSPLTIASAPYVVGVAAARDPGPRRSSSTQ